MPNPSPQTQRFLNELEELRAVFVLSQRSLPFLGELFNFVQDITVLLEEVDAAICVQDGDMPRATSQLKSVSEATELATNEILDLTDAVLEKVEDLSARLGALKACCEQCGEADERLHTLLKSELGDEHEALLAQAAGIFEEKQSLRAESAEELAVVQQALAPIRAKMNQIMMSLQVQDITAQQIASVNHLIESVRERMGGLLERLGSNQPEKSAASGGGASGPLTFDENARYNHNPDRQHVADSMVEAAMRDAAQQAGDAEGGDEGSDEAPAPPPDGNGDETSARGAAASQFDIDAMFAGQSAAGDGSSGGQEPSEHEPDNDNDTAAGADVTGNGKASQDDIDQLFSSNG